MTKRSRLPRLFMIAATVAACSGERSDGSTDFEPVAGQSDSAGIMNQPVSDSAGIAGADTGPASTGLARNPYNEEGLRLLADGNYQKASDAFARAVLAKPLDPEFRNNYGWALYLAGRREEAEKELLEVITHTPDRAIAYANLGEARLQRRDTMAAVAAYRRFLTLNKDPRRDQIARKRLKEITP